MYSLPPVNIKFAGMTRLTPTITDLTFCGPHGAGSWIAHLWLG